MASTFIRRRWLSAVAPSSSPKPWFVDRNSPPTPHEFALQRVAQRVASAPPVPEDAPAAIRDLHSQLLQSPHLELSTLVVTRPVVKEGGPLLAPKKPQGRRRRGGVYATELGIDFPSGIWEWVVMAEVKEGTENRGAIESVVRVVRKKLLEMTPSIELGPKTKKAANGWAMIDAGQFAVHILSKDISTKYWK